MNLDVRHTFGSVDLSVTVDGKPALQTRLEGSGKRFKVFGKRAERGFTKTLDLAPGVRLVRVRVQSAADKFDQTRVERFDLGSASVASMRISADKSGLSLVAERPPAPPPPAIPAAVAAAPPAVIPAALPVRQASTAVDLLQPLRSMLIAIAGFVASAATGFVVQEYLRSRKGTLFVQKAERRRRRRAGKAITDEKTV